MKYIIQFLGLCAFLLAFVKTTEVNSLAIGFIISQNDGISQKIPLLWSFHENDDVAFNFELENLDLWDTFKISRSVYSILKKGVFFVFTSVPPNYYRILQSYSERFELPLLTTHAPTLQQNRSHYEMTFSPDPFNAIIDLIKYYHCHNLVFLYEDDDDLDMVQKILNLFERRLSVEAVWKISSNKEAMRYLSFLMDINDKKASCILMSMKEEYANKIFAALPLEIKIKRKFHLILTNPVGIFNDEYSYLRHMKHTFTKLSLVDPNSMEIKNFRNKWKELVPLSNSEKNPITYSAILMSDAAEVIQRSYSAFQDLSLNENFTIKSIDCMVDDNKPLGNKSLPLISAIKKVDSFIGLTGNIQFSPMGQRINYTFHIHEAGAFFNKKIGTWTDKTLLNITGDTHKTNKSGNRKKTTSEKRRKVVVKVLLVTKFFMKKENASNETGIDSYEGYLKDILDEVAKAEDWDYEIKLLKDNKFGMKINGTHWTGLVGEIMRREADIGVAPLTVTTEREEVIDFSRPTLTFGVNILLKKPNNTDVTSSRIGILTFLQVWSYDVWLLIVLFYVILSGSIYAVNRFIGESDTIRSLDIKVSEKLSLCSSFWFVFGSLVFRSTGIYPRYLSHRILTIVWWIFSLLLLMSYISSLSFLLLQKRTLGEDSYSKNSFDILHDAVNKGHPKVGVMFLGSTYALFNDSQVGLYKDFAEYLRDNPDVYSNYDTGMKRIIDSNGDYAFVMHSTWSHLYANSEPCETMISTGFLDHKAMAFAFPKGSILREYVDDTLMRLFEEGVLRQFYDKWWNAKSSCEDPNLDILPSIYSNALTLKEVSGVFYFLILGMLIAISIGLYEYFMQRKRSSVDK